VRIAMISTPFVPVPPPRYGGTELIVAELVEGFLRAGHEVTLFATGDSQTGAEIRALYQKAEWPPDPTVELDHAAWAVNQILSSDERFDVVHAHVAPALPFARYLECPLVYTLHHDRDEKLTRLYQHQRAHYVAISARQRELVPELDEVHVIHHGLSPLRHPFGRGRGGYALFLGRFAREKGVHLAIDAAEAARVPLFLGGQPHWRDSEYYQAEVAPRLAATSNAKVVGEVGGAVKTHLLGDATALLFPVCWEEPFGLVMIEAMLCGTPVLALARGSVSEVVEEGVTGFICRDQEQLTSRLRQIAADGFDRRRCRARALERWSSRRMVGDYLALYQQLVGWGEADARSATRGV
jgi:glycosyltransferase involved in cell wall biosynthesis